MYDMCIYNEKELGELLTSIHKALLVNNNI